MKKLLALVVVALVVPSVALAKPPEHGQSQAPHGKSQASHGKSQASHGKAAPKVMYVLKGILESYAPAAKTVSGCPNGSVSILVQRANHHGVALEALANPLTVCVSSATRIVVKGGGDLTVGDRGIVKVRFAKKFHLTDSTQVAQFLATAAKQVIDQGPVRSTS